MKSTLHVCKWTVNDPVRYRELVYSDTIRQELNDCNVEVVKPITEYDDNKFSATFRVTENSDSEKAHLIPSKFGIVCEYLDCPAQKDESMIEMLEEALAV
tara:strand:- start:270 stop:569 length:300 start_codon:yes stop_codon:yes gene_type:complete